MTSESSSHSTGFNGRIGQILYDEAASAASLFKAEDAVQFLKEVKKEVQTVEKSNRSHIVLKEALRLCRSAPLLILPFFRAVNTLPREPHLLYHWVELALQLAGHDIALGVSFLTHTPQALKNLPGRPDHTSLMRWGQIGLDSFKQVDSQHKIGKMIHTYFKVSSNQDCDISLEQWPFYLSQAVRICSRSQTAAKAFIARGVHLRRQLDRRETVQWVGNGLESCGSEKELIRFFEGISSETITTESNLTSAVKLKDKKKILSLVCEAFLGRSVEIRSASGLAGNPDFSGGAATDGLRIFLPDTAASMTLYKLMALHQAMILEKWPALMADSGNVRPESNEDSFELDLFHQEVDRSLLTIMPGLGKDIQRQERNPESTGIESSSLLEKPWWGDILADFMKKTDSQLFPLLEKAAEAYEDISPDLIKALLLSLMADSDRDQDALWKLLGDMLDNIEFISPDAQELDETVQFYFYDEWDFKTGEYKKDWCQVRQRPSPEEPNDYIASLVQRLQGTIRLIRRQFQKLKPEFFKKHKAQPSGDALDIDALVTASIDRKSGAAMSENIYIRRDKRLRDVAVFFLVDVSGSTDEMVNQQRVIDIQKDAMAIMSEALESLGDPFAVYGFTSEGRFRVDMFTVKDFQDPYDEKVLYRLGNLEPMGLTRMGTGIRHAAFHLEEVNAAQKILVVLTDGRPYDLEYGNLEYAIEDTRKAVREVRSKGIHPFIITSDKKGSDYLNRISPQTECIIVENVEILPTLLPALYRRLTG